MITELNEVKSRIEQFQQECKISEQLVAGGGRLYTTPDGRNYPSVTTVLGAMEDKSWLQDWYAAVGEDEAKRITRESAQRGTEMHHLIENYLTGGEIDKSLSGFSCFNKLKIYLNKITPLGIEVPLWSDRLRVAGRTDCIGIYEGKLCIIDFKSARSEKRPETIVGYFRQATLYSMMLHERLGISAKRLVILIGTPDGFPQEFKRDAKDYVKDTIHIVRSYHELYSAGPAV